MKVDNNELNMVRNELLPNPAKDEDIDSMKTPGNEEDIMGCLSLVLIDFKSTCGKS